MLRAVNWGEKLGHVFGGHHGRILRILLLFLCALGVLVVIYRARTERLNKEHATSKNQLKSAGGHSMPAASSIKWVIVANPDSDIANSYGSGDNYVCSVALVARSAGWKTIIIGKKLNCCRIPDCYPITKHQFLKMSYRTATVIKNIMDSGSEKQSHAYKETIRNLAFLWAMHRGARYVFDAYVEEYQSAGVKISKFEEEFSRQLHTLALDESLALVEERSRSRSNLFRNPYSHFGRPDVRLLPSGPGSGAGSSSSHQHSLGHVLNYHQYTTFNLDHGHGHHPTPSMKHSTQKIQEYPTFRICEVRPPSIEKFLEIDEGWWDLRAPALVLPGDTMPPLCTRNTLFSPEVFWALPLLPDYSAGDIDELPDVPQNASRIPPWYIRGLWSQSLLGDLGGSIRLTLSRVPTLQVTQDSYTSEYDPAPLKESPVGSNINTSNHNRTGSSKLLKRWHCRSRSTFRCLLLMAKELSKSVYMSKTDLSLIEAWVMDLKYIHYTEPPMLPKRRSHTNPCLGADGLHGVSFYPALESNKEFVMEDYIEKRNETLREIVSRIETGETGVSTGQRDKRETERPLLSSNVSVNLTAPEENATFAPVDWTAYVSDGDKSGGELETPIITSSTSVDGDSYLNSNPQQSSAPSSPLSEEKPKSFGREDFVYPHVILGDAGEIDTYSRRILPLVDKPVFPSRPGYGSSAASSSVSRTGKQFRAFLQEVAAKSADAAADEFPILKAITENMCPGYGALIPFQPQVTHPDTLLIVVFTNQHYDLIPTLEVLYRSAFPNILYCGHPHESVEIFLRKYQSVEHRSFSFLPTYTRATYECVLGAMEMNYEVKGYMVVTDETLMNTWNLPNLDYNKIWVSSSGYDKVTRGSWTKLDPGGQKLPRLLEGIVATWKLFSYILIGQDNQFLEPRGIKKRSLPSEEDKVEEASKASLINESLELGESAYIPGPNFKWDSKSNSTLADELSTSEDKNSTREDTNKNGDLLTSDFDYLKSSSYVSKERTSAENDTSIGSDDTTEEEVFVGEHDEDNRPLESLGLEEGIGSSSPAPDDKVTDGSGILTDPMLVTPTEESLENSTVLWPLSEHEKTEEADSFSSTTTNPESSVGVPLYHVEHVEPPTPATWHKPEEMSSTIPTTEKDRNVTPESSQNDKVSSVGSDSDASSSAGKEINVPTSSPAPTERGAEAVTTSSTIPSIVGGELPAPLDQSELELKGDMEALLEVLHEVYINMIALVGSYQENNEEVRNQEYSSEGMDASLLEDSKSHRISPREFRHIRCTLVDDGHQSELCSTLRSYINVLGFNIGRDIRLFHDTIPMYYLPSWTTKPFYSVANVLLHYGVMDELALPLLFRGLSLESDWVHLNKTSGDALTEAAASVVHHVSTPDSDVSSSPPSKSETQYLHPLNLHKVYTDKTVRQSFCSDYLLRVLQM